jgi:DNA-binding MarR family transcriptional regulator
MQYSYIEVKPVSKVLRSFRMSFPILKYLVINPNVTPYAIEKQLDVDRPTVLASLKLLEQAGLIAVAAKNELPTGLTRKEYKATPQGVVALLQAQPTYIQITRADIQEVAAKHTEFLPLVFGKWAYFQQKRAENQAYRFLLISAKHTEDEVDRLNVVARGENLQPSFRATESMHRHDIYEGMLISSSMFGTDEAEEWAKVIRQDTELRSAAEKEISRLRGEAQEQVEHWDGALDDLHGKKHGFISLVSADAGQAEAYEYFEEYWRYQRAIALDEGKPLPSAAEITEQAIEELMEKLGFRPRKKRKQKSTRTSSVNTHERTGKKPIHMTPRQMTDSVRVSRH